RSSAGSTNNETIIFSIAVDTSILYIITNGAWSKLIIDVLWNNKIKTKFTVANSCFTSVDETRLYRKIFWKTFRIITQRLCSLRFIKNGDLQVAVEIRLNISYCIPHNSRDRTMIQRSYSICIRNWFTIYGCSIYSEFGKRNC